MDSPGGEQPTDPATTTDPRPDHKPEDPILATEQLMSQNVPMDEDPESMPADSLAMPADSQALPAAPADDQASANPTNHTDGDVAMADGEHPNGQDNNNLFDAEAASVASTTLSSIAAPQAATSEDIADAVIWGTTVNVNVAMELFREFVQNFRVKALPEPLSDDSEDEADEAPLPHYIAVLHEIYESGDMNINIDCKHLDAHSTQSRKFYGQLLHYPQEIIPIMDLVVHQEFCRLFGEDAIVEGGKRIQVRTFNLHEIKRMRQLDPSDIDQLVCIRGMIIRVSQIIPDLKQAFFRCSACQYEEEVLIDRGKIDEPEKCQNCNAKHSMVLIHNRSLYADKQMIKLQESPENIPEGETPHTVILYSYDDLVDVGKPGDRVDVTGVLRAMPIKVNPRNRNVLSVYKMHVDVLHFKTTKKKRGKGPAPVEETTVTAESLKAQEAKFRAMAQDPLIYDKLVGSLAPSIWELDDVKKGILCQLFGGTNKETGDPQLSKSLHRMRSRGEINILLCGDPGTSKSQLLGYVHKIAPRGIYTSGKGSSAVGLTAYVSKDPDTKELVLESGALVLSDRGICCIDEFDKMSDSTRSILHECMEQQTISIAKAGVIATLNARTSILASANPIESRYNPRMSIVQNISLPPTLLSRFDLIYLILDKPDTVYDRRLAKHLVGLYYDEPATRTAPIKASELADYIMFAKKHCHPQITAKAVQTLVEGYVEMRQVGAMGGGRKTITATPRQLESLIRLSEALARMRLCDEVQVSDVSEAIRLMNVATQRAAMDPRTGTIDMDAINTGMGAMERDAKEQLASEILEKLRREFPAMNITVSQLLRVMNEQSSQVIEQRELMLAVESLVDDDLVLFTPKTSTIRLL